MMNDKFSPDSNPRRRRRSKYSAEGHALQSSDYASSQDWWRFRAAITQSAPGRSTGPLMTTLADICGHLPESETPVRELTNMRIKVSLSGQDTYQPVVLVSSGRDRRFHSRYRDTQPPKPPPGTRCRASVRPVFSAPIPVFESSH